MDRRPPIERALHARACSRPTAPVLPPHVPRSSTLRRPPTPPCRRRGREFSASFVTRYSRPSPMANPHSLSPSHLSAFLLSSPLSLHPSPPFPCRPPFPPPGQRTPFPSTPLFPLTPPLSPLPSPPAVLVFHDGVGQTSPAPVHEHGHTHDR